MRSVEIKNPKFLKPDNDWVDLNSFLKEAYYFKDFIHLNEKENDKFANAITNASLGNTPKGQDNRTITTQLNCDITAHSYLTTSTSTDNTTHCNLITNTDNTTYSNLATNTDNTTHNYLTHIRTATL